MDMPSDAPSPASTEADLAADRQGSFWSELKQLYALSPRPRRRQFALVLGLMVLGTLAELATIGAVLPFIAALADQRLADGRGWTADLFGFLGIGSAADPVLAATVVFIAFVLLAGAVRLQLTWSTRRFAAGLGHDLAVETQRRTLDQSYSFHIRHNTSSLIAALDKVQTLVFDVLLQLMQSGIALFMALFILAALIAIEPIVAMAAAAVFAIFYLAISAFTAPRLTRNSDMLRSAYDERVKIVQESLGGIRDVILDRSQPLFVDAFERVDRRYSTANASTAFIASAPRFAVEAAGTALIAIVAFAIARRDGSIANALPTLGALAVGAQRLLPLVQQVYNGWSNIAGRRSIISQVIGVLSLPTIDDHARTPAVAPLPFRERIALEDVTFTYPTRARPALEAATLDIQRGARIGLVGRTGSGKSTLADLLMGLLQPTAGTIAVDGVALQGDARWRWQSGIAHVPQAVFLADESIARNIAFSVAGDAIDMDRVIEAASEAQLHAFIEQLPAGYATRVGERGVSLSGGQRQRLGLARALYKKAPVLVLDEATSALDEATEAAVIESLFAESARERTIVMITHRASALARCDLIVRIEDGRIVECGSPAEILSL